MKIQPLNAIAAAMLANSDALSVGAGSCDPCQPFGGSMSDDAGNAYDPVSVGADGGVGLLADIRKLGAQPCRMWGATPPGGCRDGCLPPGSLSKFCGKVLPYYHSITSLTDEYELKCNEFFWPLYWVDSSNAATQITSLTYNQRPVFSGTAPIMPSTSFPANGHNLVPGLPAIDNVNGMKFGLTPTNGTVDGSIVLQGHFVGIEVISG